MRTFTQEPPGFVDLSPPSPHNFRGKPYYVTPETPFSSQLKKGGGVLSNVWSCNIGGEGGYTNKRVEMPIRVNTGSMA